MGALDGLPTSGPSGRRLPFGRLSQGRPTVSPAQPVCPKGFSASAARRNHPLGWQGPARLGGDFCSRFRVFVPSVSGPFETRHFLVISEANWPKNRLYFALQFWRNSVPSTDLVSVPSFPATIPGRRGWGCHRCFQPWRPSELLCALARCARFLSPCVPPNSGGAGLGVTPRG